MMGVMRCFTFILLLFLFRTSFAQDAVATLHFESAEKAYNAGNYEEVLSKLDAAEKLTGPMSKTLYLRIVTQDKLMKRTDADKAEDAFERLTNLRENAAAYLELMAEYGLDDRYREVYAISEELSTMPKTITAWEEVKRKEEKEAHALRERSIAAESARFKREELSLYAAQKITAKDVRHLSLARFLDHDPPDQECAKIIVFRKSKMTSLIVKMPIYVNDDLVHKLKSKNYAIIKVSPGILKLNRSPHYIDYLKNKVDEKPKKFISKHYDLVSLTMAVEAGKSYYIESDYVDTEVGFTLVDKSVAEPFINAFALQEIEK